MRKRRAVKRDVLPDPIYNSKVITKDGEGVVVYNNLLKQKVSQERDTFFATIFSQKKS